MEVIHVLRLLWRRRLLVLLGLSIAPAIAFAVGSSPTPARGFAATSVMLDTAPSQLADDASFGADSLAWRATLAAQTLASDTNQGAVASAAGISPENLDITDLELTAPIIPASLPRAAVQAAYSSGKPYSLDLHTDNTVPIISISAGAPDRASAVRLAKAAVTAIVSYTSVAPDAERLALDVRTVTPIDSVEIPGGRGRKKMAAVAMVFVCMWIAGLALLPVLLGAVGRAVREADPVRS